MALILNIETSTKVCSACISDGNNILALRENFDGQSHGTLLTVFIEELLTECNIKANDLDAIAVSEGPGSYTGLRIGVSVAKGICYAVNKPLIAVNTLKAMALMAIEKSEINEAIFCSMIDARRMEVYSALFDNKGNELRQTKAEIISEESFENELKNNTVVFYGDGSEKCKETIQTENAIYIDDIYPSAKYMSVLAYKSFIKKDFKDVAYFEPFYLKDFVATIPKKKLL